MSSKNALQKKEEQIMVSVLCATYNHEKYIERALQGFLSQVTNFRFEILHFLPPLFFDLPGCQAIHNWRIDDTKNYIGLDAILYT